MRYLTLSKSGTWYFRYQLPSHSRALFDGRREIKRSLKTSSRDQAKILALQLELDIRKTMATGIVTTAKLPILQPEYTPINIARDTKLTCPYSALDKFYHYKIDHISPKTADSLKSKCKTVLDLIGKTSIRQIRRTEAETAKQQLHYYPTNVKKHFEFQLLNVTEVIELNEKLGKETLSEESIKNYVHATSSFFEWCLQNEITDVNPFKAIRFRKNTRDSDAKNAYTPDDLLKIFSHPIFVNNAHRHPHYYWLPLLAKFTGARMNELCQLYTDNIVHIDNTWCISIEATRADQRLKNPHSRRIVPIHGELIRLGFIDYVGSIASERLFPELKNSRDGYGTAASKWYGRFKSALNFDRGHDFHSFRHTVATELKNSLVSSEVASAILGHLSNSISYDRYGKGFSIEILKNAIEKIPTGALVRVKTYSSHPITSPLR
ncbi:site-specific integrase [Shewanella schlegeliana]|uniref:Site-specific integrase n=1 Tax=Shewanella schlegeliana TaxID=190308 RepID=A0ABS1T003_9GAMM|nr:site-specific integrase [Shewanella schlegeliana]MBL4914101.1 site-specific integrase [Shewanella schlegeliana]MCL1110862.1 site-specific integrase [Shewanella schlegeliana]GIU38688.1 hypothetical protein TUM4433_40610 [Shewanella schlegeliana]